MTDTPARRFWKPGDSLGDFSEETHLADLAIIAIVTRDRPMADTPGIRRAMMGER